MRVDKKLRDSQLRTVLTRSNDVFIPLDTRVAIGNQHDNSIFVSIHFNDSRRSGVQGFETYYHSPYAFDLAAAIERNLATFPGRQIAASTPRVSVSCAIFVIPRSWWNAAI